MALVEIDRPYLQFGDDGTLQAFNKDGTPMTGDKRNLGEIFAQKYGGKPMKMEMESIQMLKVDNNCCIWIWTETHGWVCFPCPPY